MQENSIFNVRCLCSILKAGMGTNFRRLRRYRPATYVAKLKIHVHAVLCIYILFFCQFKMHLFFGFIGSDYYQCTCTEKVQLSFLHQLVYFQEEDFVGKNIFLREIYVKILRINTKLSRMNAQISRIHA